MIFLRLYPVPIIDRLAGLDLLTANLFSSLGPPGRPVAGWREAKQLVINRFSGISPRECVYVRIVLW